MMSIRPALLRNPAETGFTLIELLAAMVAGSMLLASLSWTLASLGRELRATQEAKPRQRLAAAAPILTSLIEQMMPPTKNEAAIVADPRRLVFVTSPPAALGEAGPVRATLSVRPDAPGESLYLRFEPADGWAAFPPAARTERPLLRHYRQIRFEYRMPDKEDGLPPRLVTIRLIEQGGGAARLAAAPRVTTSGDCRFDPVSMACRR